AITDASVNELLAATWLVAAYVDTSDDRKDTMLTIGRQSYEPFRPDYFSALVREGSSNDGRPVITSSARRARPTPRGRSPCAQPRRARGRTPPRTPPSRGLDRSTSPPADPAR